VKQGVPFARDQPVVSCPAPRRPRTARPPRLRRWTARRGEGHARDDAVGGPQDGGGDGPHEAGARQRSLL